MTYTVGPKGQVVIPKAIRDELGIEPGDQVVVTRERERVVIRRGEDVARDRRRRVRSLRGRLAGPGAGTADLEAVRRAERAREDRRTNPA